MSWKGKSALALVGAVAVAVLMILPGGYAHVGPSSTVPTGPGDFALDPTGFPPAAYSNLEIAPPPPVPHTPPVVLNLAAYGTVAIPWGDWETVVMNYTGYTAGTAYDYFQTVTIDSAMVYVGVNPEAGHWTQFVNLSAYLSFFDDRANITISGPALGNGTNFEGIQDNYIALLFYPIPAGGHSPSYASMVEPLFQFNGDPAQATIDVPSNASAVVLQMIGIGSEFWYSLNPDFTAITTAVGGVNVSTYLQYPWINSGGIDLFSWRPIPPVNMLDHQWESFNLTGALGLLESNSTLTVSPAAGSLGADVIANLLVYTEPNVRGAQQTAYSYDQGPVRTHSVVNTSYDNGNPNGNNYAIYDQHDAITYGYSARIATTSGAYWVSSSTSEHYGNDQSLTLVWQNITESEVTETTQVTTYDEAGLHGSVVTSQRLSYPLAMDLGYAINYLYSIGSDAYFNYTSYFYNVHQGYTEVDQSASDVNGRIATSYDSVQEAILGTNGFFQSLLEEGPGFAIILNITASLHTTREVYTQVDAGWTPRSASLSYYHHVLAGVEDNSTKYYVQEKVTVNRVTQFHFGYHEWERGAPGR
ncbi:MAG: hypothetical protein WBF81_00010 [Thermoplasmata archaeon]